MNMLNSASYCGLTWQKGQQQDVIDKSCLGMSHQRGEVVFDVYKVDDNGKQLTLGRDTLFSDKADPSARPKALDTANSFTKQ